MVDSDIFGAYISHNLAHAICLSLLTAHMIDVHCRQVKIHSLPQNGVFSRDWESVAQVTKVWTVD